VEQNVNQTLKVADRAYVIENGKIVMDGQAQELMGDDHIRKAYLGI
ncbi:MAG: branched-chain amino acid ABC transporter ATP-binding protein, partial [Pseudomonadota bacterium]|nr:branched-chain amino acid ABC transporter ATP-binding protein [Pseudomonadota bacterium]